MKFRNLFVFLILTINWNVTYATTVAAPQHLGELKLSSDHVVFAKFIKSYTLSENGIEYTRFLFHCISEMSLPVLKIKKFELQAWGQKRENINYVVAGDIHFEKDKSYLLFLDKIDKNLYRPKLMSYAIYEELIYENKEYLVPITGAQKINNINADNLNAYNVNYIKTNLLESLERFQYGTEWNQNHLITSTYLPNQNTQKDAPPHCAFLGDPRARWQFIDSLGVNVSSSVVGDISLPDSSLIHDYVNTAAAVMNVAYPGISMNFFRIYSNFIPNCQNNSAVSGNFDALDNFLGSRNLILQYNDPCDQIPDIQNCNGVLAYGGVGWDGIHNFNGESWRTVDVGFVVTNNGISPCYGEQDYIRMLIHEMTHGIGLDHINNSLANLYQTCCNPVTSLDWECVEYAYPSVLTPLATEYIDLHGSISDDNIQLNWNVNEGHNANAFFIEKSIDAQHFITIHEIQLRKNQSGITQFEFEDNSAVEGKIYYRIKATDDLSDPIHSNIIELDYFKSDQFRVFPNPARNKVTLIIPKNQQTSSYFKLIDAMGRVYPVQVDRDVNNPTLYSLDLSSYSAGLYFIHIYDGVELTVKAIVKS